MHDFKFSLIVVLTYYYKFRVPKYINYKCDLMQDMRDKYSHSHVLGEASIKMEKSLEERN
jgi:hypothetical protein